MNAHRFARLRALALLLLTSVLLCPVLPLGVSAEGEETHIFPVNAVNGTRWEQTLIVYRNAETTGQNQYGWNIVVDADGKVIEKIPAGDSRGRDLAIPAGGMVVSGCDDPGKLPYDACEIGSNVYFDAYSSRVLISAGEIDPFYEYTLQATTFNDVRYAQTIVLYDRGETTGTNGYGYEVCVGADGRILSAGGNDNAVPEGGYVISAIEKTDINLLKTYFIPGASCELDGLRVTVRYEPPMLMTTARAELADIRRELETAKEELRLVDYDGVEEQLADAEAEIAQIEADGGFPSFAARDELLARLTPIRLGLTERAPVGVRSVWYVPTELNAESAVASVRRMAEVGINQLRLGVSNGHHTIVPMPEALDDGEGGSIEFPFRVDTRCKNVDLLAVYAEECRAEGIELVVSIPVFQNSGGVRYQKEWQTTTNRETANLDPFFSPANDAYRAYFSAYVRYIIQHYDISGLEFDYIRYPYFDGSVDYGYDEITKQKFAEKTGLPASTVDEIGTQLRSHPQWNEWVQFRAGLITEFLEELRGMIDDLRPDLYVTAAVADDTALASYCQDSRTWMDRALVDGIYPMSYGEGLMRSSTEKFSPYRNEKTFLVMGSGAYMSFTEDEIALQAKQAPLYGADGIAYFEWSAYEKYGYADFLRGTVYENDALSFTAHESESVKLLVEQAKKRFALFGADADDLFGQYESGEIDLPGLLDALREQNGENAFLYRDLDLAVRIENFSREAYRGTVELLPIDVSVGDESEGDDGADASSAEESVSADEPSASEESGRGWLYAGIAAAVAAVAVIAAVGVFAVRRKGKKKRDRG